MVRSDQRSPLCALPLGTWFLYDVAYYSTNVFTTSILQVGHNPEVARIKGPCILQRAHSEPIFVYVGHLWRVSDAVGRHVAVTVNDCDGYPGGEF